MNRQFFVLAIGGSLALGFGLGFGLAMSDKPFVLEVTDTPVGSFMFRGNLVYPSHLPPNYAALGQPWVDRVV
jgi:hypothetical protein